jgi:hypothetical protein
MKHLPVYVLIAAFSFSFGWASRGDQIYGRMFKDTIENLGTVLPIKAAK